MKPDFGSRVRSAFADHGHLCIGIDPSPAELRVFKLQESVKSLEIFSNDVLEVAIGRVGFIKPQVAFFERFGSSGFAVLERLCAEATRTGMVVIADAKRGDIGSTLRGYAAAWLEESSPFIVDALTLSPYLGPESLSEAVDAARAASKGVFVLGATSNPEGQALQKSVSPAGTVASLIAEFAASANESSFGPVGIVLGATLDLHDFGVDEGILRNVPILAPGFGHQGARLKDARKIFGNATGNIIANVGRSITSGGRSELISRINDAKAELAEGMAL